MPEPEKATSHGRLTGTKSHVRATRIAFGEAFRNARIEAEMSQSDIPGLDQSYISKVERGEANPTLGKMVKLAAAVHRNLIVAFGNPVALAPTATPSSRRK